MKIRIHPETTEGKPITGDGVELVGTSAAEVVELMRLQTPFSAALPLAAYRDEVLLHVEGPERKPLPNDAEAANVAFLTRLAQAGRLEFLPEDEPTEAPTQKHPSEEEPPCVGK